MAGFKLSHGKVLSRMDIGGQLVQKAPIACMPQLSVSVDRRGDKTIGTGGVQPQGFLASLLFIRPQPDQGHPVFFHLREEPGDFNLSPVMVFHINQRQGALL